MGYKTISLNDAVYRKLRAERRSDESFNDTISRLLTKRQPSLRDYFGAWKPMSRREYYQVRERINQVRHGTP